MSYAQHQFDVFLAHNSQDKPLVRAIANELKRRGLNPWLDEEQIPPGRSFQDEIQQAIPLSKSAAIFLGLQGLGKWQIMELRSLTTRCVENGISVIPALLPGVSEFPQDLLFLKEFKWVSFSDGIDDENALYDLEWGITGKKPEPIVKAIPQSQSDDVSYEPKKEVPNTQELRNLEVIETQNTPQNQQDDLDDNLSSARGVNYTQLRDLLKAGQWKEADQETLTVMLRVAGKEQESWLRKEDIESFPCTDLRTMDTLWAKYSKEHFGFSMQKHIWQSVGGNPGVFNEETWFSFGERVGWRTTRHHQIFLVTWTSREWSYYSQINFNLDAPEGHLPRMWNEWRGGVEISSIASRLVECNV
ncbi:GUN4 domain-containing protein [Mastigocladopsis repens]|uniref:GUN4 domain-containing protein n=1 Tax=Mastigocladopsis repens TaxID=221287 RepID=UPI0002F8A685|nr:GUN4 domain-containing protein [Mastigocladopsis repens]